MRTVKRKRNFSWAAGLLLMMSTWAVAGPPDGWPFVSYEAGLEQAKKTKSPVFILFGQDPCPYCDTLKKQALSDRDLRDLFAKEYVLVYVDVVGLNEAPEHVLPDSRTMSHRAFVRHHKAYATPSWSFYDRDGTLALSGTGSKETSKDFKRFHQYVKNGAYKTMSLDEFLSRN